MLLVMVGLVPTAAAGQRHEDVVRAERLAFEWRATIRLHLDDLRINTSPAVTADLDPFISFATVRAVRDRATRERLAEAESQLRRLAVAMRQVGSHRPDGSVDLDAEAWRRAQERVCPIYPFC